MIERRGERLRVGPWRGDPHVAHLTPVPGSPSPSADFVLHCLDTLARDGYRRAVTGALAPAEQAGYRMAGFVVTEDLHLLSHDLSGIALAGFSRAAMHRPAAKDWTQVLAVDTLAFDPFWRLDHAGLVDAIGATPHARFRAASWSGGSGPQGIVGYAITGRAGKRGYLQRLAVHPDHQGQGLGQALVMDGLRWLRRWRVEHAMVNTQLQNARALALYEHLGFRREPNGLSVLGRELAG